MKIIDRLTLWQYLLPQTKGSFLALIFGDVSYDLIAGAIPPKISMLKLFLKSDDKRANPLIINFPDNSVGGAIILGHFRSFFNHSFFSELFRVMMPGAAICFFLSKRMHAFSIKRNLKFYGFEFVRSYGVFPSFNYPKWVIPLRTKYFISATKGIFKPIKFIKKFLWNYFTLFSYISVHYLLFKNYFLVVKKKAKSASKKNNNFLTMLSHLLGQDDFELALLNRPQKYYQKTTAQVMDANGDTIAYIKIADTPQSRALLVNEKIILEVLENLDIQTAEIPDVIFFNENDLEAILVQRAEPSLKEGPIYLSPEHVFFLVEIFRKTAKTYKFKESPLFKNMEEGLKNLEGKTEERWQHLLEAVLENILHRFKDNEIQLGLTHWDFAAWNTSRNKNGKLIIFDWELATLEDLPLMDFYNFIIHTEGLIKFKKGNEILSKLLNRRGPYFSLMNQYKKCLGSDTFFDPFGFLLVYLYKSSIYYLGYQNMQKQLGFDSVSGFELLKIIRPMLGKVLYQI